MAKLIGEKKLDLTGLEQVIRQMQQNIDAGVVVDASPQAQIECFEAVGKVLPPDLEEQLKLFMRIGILWTQGRTRLQKNPEAASAVHEDFFRRSHNEIIEFQRWPSETNLRPSPLAILRALQERYEYVKVYENIAVVKRHKKWGVVDTKTGEETVAPQFDMLIVSKPLATVMKNGKWGIIEVTTGREIVPILYSSIRVIEGFVNIKRDGKWGVFDLKSEREVITPQYDFVHFYKFLAKVRKSGRWGLLDKKTWEEIVAPRYDSIEHRQGRTSFAEVRVGDKYGLVDMKTGKEIIAPQYDYDEMLHQLRLLYPNTQAGELVE